jgi:altronate dehydratase small subunit
MKAFRIHPEDNVAVLLEDCEAGEVEILGAGVLDPVRAAEPIRAGHKIALADIGAGEPLVKYGIRIGHATTPIARGQWVHLHNGASDYDARSNTLDAETGAPTDMVYE